MIVYLSVLHILVINIGVECILGGNEIEIEEAPYQVNYGDVCGGVLIHKRWAITTAHCGTENFIRVGDKNRLRARRIRIIKNIVHPLFGKRHEFDYDIQLLQLRRGLKWDYKFHPINISVRSCEKYVYITGWGYPKEKGDYLTNLQRVKLNLVSLKKCQRVKEKWYNYTLTNTMFCAGKGKTKDACQGDSGGAAVCDGSLAGISSFGYGCGRGIPGVYTNVTDASVRQWIHYHTGV
ncbi:trypsin domain-containing protein [Phthorimaea operculella]|nr:trypsin domain-containing protein [Phthorimaea operculella]